MSDTTAAQDFREMMDAWNTIEAAAKREFPDAGAEELYQIAAGAFRAALLVCAA